MSIETPRLISLNKINPRNNCTEWIASNINLIEIHEMGFYTIEEMGFILEIIFKINQARTIAFKQVVPKTNKSLRQEVFKKQDPYSFTRLVIAIPHIEPPHPFNSLVECHANSIQLKFFQILNPSIYTIKRGGKCFKKKTENFSVSEVKFTEHTIKLSVKSI